MRLWAGVTSIYIAAAGILPVCTLTIAADKVVVSTTAPTDGPGAPLADEATWLPIENVTLADVHNAFAPSYAGETAALLPEPLRDALEQSVFRRLHFMMQNDEESCRYGLKAAVVFWGQKPLPENYKLRKEQMDQAIRSITDGPVRRLGFPDRPFQVRRARLDQAFPELAAMLPPSQKATSGREVLVVTVQTILKVTPEQPGQGLYRPCDLRLVCDPAAPTPIFHIIQDICRRPLSDPATDLPLLLRSAPDGSPQKQ